MSDTGAHHGDAHLPVDADKIVGRSRLLGDMLALIGRKPYSIRTAQKLSLGPFPLLFHEFRENLPHRCSAVSAYLHNPRDNPFALAGGTAIALQKARVLL